MMNSINKSQPESCIKFFMWNLGETQQQLWMATIHSKTGRKTEPKTRIILHQWSCSIKTPKSRYHGRCFKKKKLSSFKATGLYSWFMQMFSRTTEQKHLYEEIFRVCVNWLLKAVLTWCFRISQRCTSNSLNYGTNQTNDFVKLSVLSI